MKLVKRFLRWLRMKDEDPEQLALAQEARRAHESDKMATFGSSNMRGRKLP